MLQGDLLSSLLSAVSKRVNQHSFNTWFQPISTATKDSSTIYLTVPSDMFSDWIINNYFDVLEESLLELGLTGCRISFRIDDAPAAVGTSGSGYGFQATGAKPAPVAYSDQAMPAATRFIDLEPVELRLNAKYTFDTFVVGSSNQFAHAAAQAVADMPSKTYNPLYIYGGVGLGKTHLMHAIGHLIKGRNPSTRLTYLSSERFMNELINAIRYDKTITFREKYRNIDVLLMDDIQFLAG